jgi:hypothetical protein
MFSDSCSERTALAANDKLFVFLLYASRSAYGFQRSERLTDPAIYVAVVLVCCFSPS